MKIVKIIEDMEQPNACQACDDKYNGTNYVMFSLFEGFSIWIGLCEKCLERLRVFLKFS